MGATCRVAIHSPVDSDNVFYGDSTSNYFQWDASANTLALVGTTCRFNIGTFNSTTKGYGEVLNATYTAVQRVYADDNGAAAWAAGSVPDQRVILARNLFTTDQTGGDLRSFAVMGHIKAYNAKWNDEQIGGVHGYIELVRGAGTITYGGNGITAGVQATVENSGAVTVNTSHVLAGVAAVSKMTSDLTQTGKTAAFYAGIYDATNWSDTSTARAKWGYGLYVDPLAVTTAISVGVQANTAGSGYPLATATAGAVRVFADDNGASVGDSVRALQGRVLLTFDQTGGTIRATQGQLKLLTGIDVTSGIYTALQGYVEMAGTHIAKTGSTFSTIDSSTEIGTSLTVDSGGEYFGVHVETTGAGTITNNGTCAAIGITKASGAASWPVGLHVQGSGVVNGASIGTAAVPVTLAAVANYGLSVYTTAAFTTASEYDAVKINAVQTGAGAIAVALRVNLESNVKLGDWSNAAYISLDLKTAGGAAGLGTAICGELVMGAGATEGTFGVFEGEINCPASWTGTGPVSFLYLNAYGSTVANFDTYGYLFTLTGVSSGANNLWYDNQKAAPAVEEFIRVKTPAGDRFLGLYNANA